MPPKKQKYLYVIAAGESDGGAPVLNELKRPLSKRGVAQVLNLLETWKECPVILPDIVLCSPSLYVCQTLDLLHEVLKNVDIVCKDALYAAPDYRVLETIATMDDILSRIMIVGELPGIKQFVNYVSNATHQVPLKPAEGLLLTMDANISWHEMTKQKTRCRPLFN